MFVKEGDEFRVHLTGSLFDRVRLSVEEWVKGWQMNNLWSLVHGLDIVRHGKWITFLPVEEESFGQVVVLGHHALLNTTLSFEKSPKLL